VSSLGSMQPLSRRDRLVLHATEEESGDISDSSANGDEAEWKAVLNAFKLYKAAYGDLRVPRRFVVPNMKPWPKSSWGLKLGKVVANIRSTGKYVQPTASNGDGTGGGGIDDETVKSRRQQLEDLGFIWRVRDNAGASSSTEQIPLDQLYAALESYRDVVVAAGEEGDRSWTVPTSFYVPDLDPWPESVRGMPLGRQIEGLKDRLSRSKESVKRRFQHLGLAELEENKVIASTTTPSTDSSSESSEEGLTEEEHESQNMSANDVRFQNVYNALTTYKKLYGDLLVPQPFAVPKSDEWPEETWGLRLGARVNAIRSQGTFVNSNPERRQLLDELGFIWATPKDGSSRRGRKTRLLETDEPSMTSSPGGDVDGDKESMDSLFDGSFDFSREFDFSQTGEKTSPTWGLVDGGRELQEAAAAAEEAARAEEEYLPPRTLAESLKEATERAIDVGVIEGMTENKRVIKGKQEKDIPWFNDDFGDAFVFEDVVEAITTYKSIYGDFSNLTESDEFVVPAPKEITGFLDDDDEDNSFGGAFDADASARAAAAIAMFEEQGDMESSEAIIASEVSRLQEEIFQPGTGSEAETSVIKKQTSQEEWPEHLAGMPLGSIVARIRDGSLEVKHLPERKAQLDAIDFDWGDPARFIDVPFEKAMCAMYAYYLIRGDMFVYEDFVMPDEDPWPQALAGYEIGKAVKRIRELQNFLEAYHPEKVSLLRMIDFVWFPTMALPLDPNETEMNSEMLLLSAMGHPDYAKMIDIPMGLPDKIVADGPFFETDDPKLWWRKWHNWEYVKDYWYQQGRRDNAYVLRGMGYPRMAEEHEAKYGPGLFTQINETLEEIDAGIDDKTVDEKREMLEKLNFFRQEMLGCTDIHPQDRNEMLAKFDDQMLEIMKDANIQKLVREQEEHGANDEDMQGKEDDNDIEEDIDVEDSFEIDVDDELGL